MNLDVATFLQRVGELEKKLSYSFRNPKLLLLAHTHRSYYNEHKHEVDDHNERIEFLGDSVLGLIVSQFLYRKLPDSPEGELSHLRAHLVDAKACVEFAQALSLEKWLLLGRGEKMSSGRGREGLIANLFEAVMGAIYLDGGYEAAEQFFLRHFQEEVEKKIKTPLRNWKAEFQDYAQKKLQKTPLYRVLEESGPDHSKTFLVAAFIGEEEMGRGTGSSKKAAEQAAAEDAFSRIDG